MKLYENIDSFLLQGANAGVHAWNWTTGRTRADLSTLVGTAGLAFFNMHLLGKSKTLGMAVLPIASLLAYANHKSSKTQDGAEVKAAEKGLKDMRVEYFKYLNKKIARNFTLISAAGTFIDVATPEDLVYLNLSSVLMAANAYIMRADYLPPRKNCLSRGIDKLSESLSELNYQPVPVPVYRSNS